MSHRCDICSSEILGRPIAAAPRLCLLCRLSAEEVADILNEAGVPNEIRASREFDQPNVLHLHAERRQGSSRATP
jgi:hypothetical protein